MQPQTERRRRITLLFGDVPANLVAVETILDSMAASVWAVRPHGELSYANRRWWEFSGLHPTERDLGACLDVVHPDDRDQARRQLQGAMRGGESYEARWRLRRASDGAYRWHLCRALPVEGTGGVVLGWIMVATDIQDLVVLTADLPGAPPDPNVRRMRALLRDGPMPILMVEGAEHRCVFLNAAAEALLRRDAVGRRFCDAFPDLSGRLLTVLDHVYRTGQPYAARELPVTGDGSAPESERFLDLTFQPARDATGSVFGILVAGVDVSGQIRARAEIERHADRLARLQEVASALSDVLDPALASDVVVEQARSALGAASAAVALVDDGRKIIEPVASSGATAPAFLRMPLDAALPPAEAARTGDAVVLESRHELVARYPDLGPWVDESGSEALLALPLVGQSGTIGALTLTFGSSRGFDASEWDFVDTLARQCGEAIERARLYRLAQTARMEADLQRERLRTIILDAPVPMVVCSGSSHTVVLANPSWRALLRHGGEEVTGWPVRSAFPALERNGVTAVLDRAFLGGDAVMVSEASLHVEGRGEAALEELLVNLTAQPYRDSSGQTGGVMVVATEVTAEVRARRRLEREVAARVASERQRAELLEQERATRARAETANRAKDEFLAMLGHELRNPLAPIVTALQILKMRGQAEARELTIIDRQVKHLVRLVDDLLDVSRITRGAVQLKRELVELAVVVSKAVEMASPLLEQRGHHLALDVPATGLPLEADVTRLAQVLANLLTNAAKYTDPGGHIAVRAARQGDRIVLRVNDDGIGIAADLLPIVFDLFVQGTRALDRSEGGLGIGLTLARSLVALHGGTIQAHSDGPGRGSEFMVALPVPAAPADAARGREISGPWAPEPKTARGRVLIVDDNADAADLLAELVRSAGYEVAIAHDGPQALATAAHFVPQVAVLDIGLPVMDGFELARRLRGRPGAEGLRLIAVTGYGQQHDRDKSRTAGFEQHLIKPVDAKVLLDALDR